MLLYININTYNSHLDISFLYGITHSLEYRKRKRKKKKRKEYVFLVEKGPSLNALAHNLVCLLLEQPIWQPTEPQPNWAFRTFPGNWASSQPGRFSLCSKRITFLFDCLWILMSPISSRLFFSR